MNSDMVYEIENLGNLWMVWEIEYLDGVGSATACCDDPMFMTKGAAKEHIKAHQDGTIKYTGE